MHYIFLTQTNTKDLVTNGWSAALSVLGQLFFLTVAVIAILFLTAWVTKFVGRFKLGNGNTANMEILEILPLSSQQMALQLIKAGNKYFIIGITKDKISYLTEVNADSLALTPQDEDAKPSGKALFDKYLKDFVSKNKKRDS